jgi:hypothetical protein
MSMSNDLLFKPYVILTVAIAVQSFHMLEHIAQVVQKFVLQLPVAHGLLGASLDFEPVHFAFNVLYLALVAAVWISFRKTPIRKMNLIYGLVTFVLVFQSWHFIEHAVKLEQHFVKGCVSCPGILGYYFDPILLHFTYNTIVYVPLIVIFVIFQYKFVLKVENIQK